jgi:hypothetical protein
MESTTTNTDLIGGPGTYAKGQVLWVIKEKGDRRWYGSLTVVRSGTVTTDVVDPDRPHAGEIRFNTPALARMIEEAATS